MLKIGKAIITPMAMRMAGFMLLFQRGLLAPEKSLSSICLLQIGKRV
jgi:hypothetical protein